MKPRSNLVGRKFGLLNPIRVINNSGVSIWECICDCGNKRTVSLCHLLSGNAISCGCMYNGRKKYSIPVDRIYKIFHSMKQRCYKTNNSQYKNYGGRGISICNEWLNDFLSFKSWTYRIYIRLT